MQKFPNSIIELVNEDFHLLVVKKGGELNPYEILLSSELDLFLKLKTAKRQQEFLLARYLRNFVLGNIPIGYKDSGKPFLLNDERFISISHSKDFLGVLISKYNCSLDIEEISNKVEKVKFKFLNENEGTLIPNDPKNLTRAWTVKEVLYKLSDFPIRSYTSELLILSWEEDNVKGITKTEHKSIEVSIHSILIDELIISYTFDNSKS
jgi:4'-phosphopantetheinyl transferase